MGKAAKKTELVEIIATENAKHLKAEQKYIVSPSIAKILTGKKWAKSANAPDVKKS